MTLLQEPSTMIGVQHDRSTGELHLELSSPMPVIAGDQYLVKVAATAITTGELSWPRSTELTISCPGVDAAGTIIAGPIDGKFHPGDRVYFRTTYPRAGSARQYSVATENEIARCPRDMPMVEAAAIPTSALTAWQALFEQSGLSLSIPPPKPHAACGTRVFVNGASGGVGLFLIQLARLAGCEVVGTSTNEDLLKSLGASEVINYRETSISQWLEANPDKRFDLVLDLVGGESLREAWYAARENTNVITLVPPKNMQWKWVLDRPAGISETIKGKFYIVRPDGNQLKQISELFEQGKLQAVVDSIHNLEDFKNAFARVDSGRAIGKVVIQVDRTQ